MRRQGGVYAITCLINEWVYVGIAMTFKSRWMTHTASLRRGNHFNPDLQRDWNIYGEQAFLFEILEAVEPYYPTVFERERYWLNCVQSLKMSSYNVSDAALRAAASRQRNKGVRNVAP